MPPKKSAKKKVSKKIVGPSPKDIFLQLFATAMLYLSIIGTFVASFALISYFLPSDDYSYPSNVMDLGEMISFPLAMLVVAFPLFVWSTRAAQQRIRAHKALQSSRARVWLSNLTLFLAAIIVTITAIAVVYTFFNGALKASTLLRSLIVAAVSILTILWYKGGEEPELHNSKLDLGVAGIASVLFVALIVVSIVSMGSPADRRDMRADRDTRSDVSGAYYDLGSQISDYSTTNERPTLKPFPDTLRTEDTVVYTRVDDTNATLCATFKTDYEDDEYSNYYGTRYYEHGGGVGSLSSLDLSHTEGEHCFDVTVE